MVTILVVSYFFILILDNNAIATLVQGKV